MIVLAYLVDNLQHSASDRDQLQESPRRILLGSRRTQEDDDDHLSRFCKILAWFGKEGTFEALEKSLPFQWSDKQRYDLVDPFGDFREADCHALWTLDLSDDVLRYTSAKCRKELPLSLLRERRVSFAEMKTLPQGARPSEEGPATSDACSWAPTMDVDSRLRAFVYRLLRDFGYQWRHIFRSTYNSITLRALARAVIRLSTLDFHVRESTAGHEQRADDVWITQSPWWEPFESDIVPVGTLWVVLCRDLADGLSKLKKHRLPQDSRATRAPNTSKDVSGSRTAQYMLLTLRNIALCHADEGGMIMHTASEPLFQGHDDLDHIPNDRALDYLVWATASARPSIPTRVQLLPIELQDMVLRSVSTGMVATAYTGCLLLLGSAASWKERCQERIQKDDLDHPLERPVESEIYFDNHRSGLVYLTRSI